MDAEELLNQIQLRTHPQGEVLIHVVTQDREHWLEVTGTDRASHGAIPWIDGVVIETKPIPEGSRASREITTPRPFFQQKIIEDLACKSPEQIMEMRRTGELQTIYGVDPGNITGFSKSEITLRKEQAEGRSLADVEHDDHAARIPLLPEPQEISGEFAIDVSESAYDRMQRLMDRFGMDPYESTVLSPQRMDPIVGKTLHQADPSIPDLSEPHYEAARELNTSIINDLLVKGAQEEFGSTENTEKENDQ